MTYAFTFDESACTGCKACQAACKDKNNLPLGVLWRRVYEIAGGEWRQIGNAWTSTVFAYNLSIACNHCAHPKCAGVCPVDAYEVRSDGIVLINTEKCIGCGYCAWACPYDAPQVDKSAGCMTKCNLCCDYLDTGLPPACVAACPLRCLELVDINERVMESKGLALWEIPGAEHPFPLANYSRTEPHLVIMPHRGTQQVGEGTTVVNREETSPARPRAAAKDEIPLILFTLLVQMAIGAFGTIVMIQWLFMDKLAAGQVTLIPLIAVGVAITVAWLGSFFHLGSPKNAWRALNHLRKSWLSREILFTSGFMGLWAIYTGTRLLHFGTFLAGMMLALFTLFCGLIALYSMQSVYRLRSVPSWNTGRTLLEFTISPVVLGCLLTGTLLPPYVAAGIIRWIALAAVIAFSAAGLAVSTTKNIGKAILYKLRSGLLLVAILGGLFLSIWPSTVGAWGTILLFIIALVEETIGRWLFYLRRIPGM